MRIFEEGDSPACQLSNMMIRLDTTGSLSAFKECLASTLAEDSIEGIMILSCEANQWPASKIDQFLHQVRLPVFGGVFPEIMAQGQRYEKGFLILGLDKKPDVHLLPLNNMEIWPQLTPQQQSHALVFVDAYAAGISELMKILYQRMGMIVPLLGAGAGGRKEKNIPALFSNQGMCTEHAMLVFLDGPMEITLGNHVQQLFGPIPMTLGDDPSVIQYLAGRPAFELYQELILSETGQELTRENFAFLARKYPLGSQRLGTNPLVREPLAVLENGSILCAGGFEGDYFVSMLELPNKPVLPVSSISDVSSSFGFMLYSSARAQLFGEAYEKDLQSLSNIYPSYIGALSLGEIACQGIHFPEYHNYSAAVGVFGA